MADALMGVQERSAATTGAERMMGGGLPAMLLGQAPSVLDNMSYGRMPVSGTGMATRLDPAAMDVAGLVPGMQAAKGKALAVALMGSVENRGGKVIAYIMTKKGAGMSKTLKSISDVEKLMKQPGIESIEIIKGDVVVGEKYIGDDGSTFWSYEKDMFNE